VRRGCHVRRHAVYIEFELRLCFEILHLRTHSTKALLSYKLTRASALKPTAIYTATNTNRIREYQHPRAL